MSVSDTKPKTRVRDARPREAPNPDLVAFARDLSKTFN